MTLFDKDDSDIVTIDPNKDWLNELVGEGKKYQDPASLARAKAEADAMIQNILREKKEMEKLLEQSLVEKRGEDKFEELKKIILEGRVPPQDTPPAPEPSRSEFDPGKLDELLEQKLQNREKVSREQQNLDRVYNKLREVHGANAKAFFEQAAAELGGKDFLTSVAKHSPDAFFKAVGLGEKDVPVTPPRTQGRPEPKPSGGLSTYKDFMALKKADTRKFNSAQIQHLYMEQAAKLGDAFFD